MQQIIDSEMLVLCHSRKPPYQSLTLH
jgi:hypothetical protein